MPRNESQLRKELGLTSASQKPTWEKLRKFIDEVLHNYVDISASSLPAIRQTTAVDKVIRLVSESESHYFSEDQEVNRRKLREHILRRTNFLRYTARKEFETIDRRTRMATSQTKGKRVQLRSSARQYPGTQIGSSATTDHRVPPRLVRFAPPIDESETPESSNHDGRSSSPDDDDDEEPEDPIYQFLAGCSPPLTHLHSYLVKYGLNDTQHIETMSSWSEVKIREVVMEMKDVENVKAGRGDLRNNDSERGPAAQTPVMFPTSMDWQMLSYWIWKYGRDM
ncbi:hypothetical protein BDN72DRAFT_962549 [Pluteus cervinus]|uniref:Uncharacterized protein n=1 Tax=Pluteus cervinus TaxID=181527 RepID=A0ACD3AID8_9AGAR|nr:hypothetical protein BDN72DRAFT_962549 [Pluteus cervinus]